MPIDCTILYWGPAGAGKSENLAQLRRMLASAVSRGERDEVHLSLGGIHGLETMLSLYAAPGPLATIEGRSSLLLSCHGLVFVADSDRVRQAANHDSWRELEDVLRQHGRALEDLPLLIEYNKRDLPGALPLEELERSFNAMDLPAVDTVASEGSGVLDALCAIAERAIARV